MSGSNCYLLTFIQVLHEAGQMASYSHIFKNFPESVVIHTVKGFGILNKAEIDAFLELSCFFHEACRGGKQRVEAKFTGIQGSAFV